MRYRTIQKRLRLALLPKEALQWLHRQMHGIPDTQTTAGRAKFIAWSEAVAKMLQKWPNPDHKEQLIRAITVGVPTKIEGQWYYRTSFGPRSEIFVLRLNLQTESPVWINSRRTKK